MSLEKYENKTPRLYGTRDLVLDCFSGSGTTAIACCELKRNFICIEKKETFYKASIQRLKNNIMQTTLF